MGAGHEKMFPSTAFTKLAGVEFPILGAPMAGASTIDLTVAISEAGGMGPLPAAALQPDAIRKQIEDARKRTNKPFNVNLFVLGEPKADPKQVARALELLAPIREELGLPPGAPLERYCPDNAAQMEAVLEARPAMASFTFGILSKEQVAAFQARGILVMGTATTVAEARAWEA